MNFYKHFSKEKSIYFFKKNKSKKLKAQKSILTFVPSASQECAQFSFPYWAS